MQTQTSPMRTARAEKPFFCLRFLSAINLSLPRPARFAARPHGDAPSTKGYTSPSVTLNYTTRGRCFATFSFWPPGFFSHGRRCAPYAHAENAPKPHPQTGAAPRATALRTARPGTTERTLRRRKAEAPVRRGWPKNTAHIPPAYTSAAGLPNNGSWPRCGTKAPPRPAQRRRR